MVPASGVLTSFGHLEVAATAQVGQTHSRVIHVSVQSPTADDGNPGTDTLPLKTIGRGVQLAVADNAKRTSATVLIHPGTYRETISIPPGGTDAALTLQATEKGKAVISGSDVWKGWTRWDGRGIYVHAWPYAWGLAPIPSGWPSLRDIVRHREMVFVDGLLLTQVLSADQMTPGTFSVDEGAHRVFLWAPRGSDPTTATVEVAVRDPLLKTASRMNLTIRGLVFEHAATALDAAAVMVDGMRAFVVEDTTFRWNNWGGLAISGSADAIIRRTTGIHNGARGMSDWKNKRLLFEDTETSYNNWRGAWGGFYGWAVAGIKNMLLHDGVFRRHKSVGNATYGFWLDTDNRNITIENGLWCDNVEGAFIEASQGPIVIARTIICRNKSIGLITSISGHVTLRDSVLYDNGGDAQFATNDVDSGTAIDWETGETISLRTEHWTFCGNVLAGTKRRQHLLSLPSWDFFRDTLRLAQNVYWNPARTDVFWLRSIVIRGHSLAGRSLDLQGWQRISGQDAGSIFADPRFADANQWNFSPLPSSPWRKCP